MTLPPTPGQPLSETAGKHFYSQPAHGWTCFHCGETFTTPGAAKDHFGGELNSLAACQIKVGEERGLVMALRRAEDELGRYRAEDSDKDREMGVMRAAHTQALQCEEEKGYERGLRDGMATKPVAHEPTDALAEAIAREIIFGLPARNDTSFEFPSNQNFEVTFAQVVGPTASALSASREVQDSIALSASDASCYKWPNDTDEHKALRAAFVEGAVSAAGVEGDGAELDALSAKATPGPYEVESFTTDSGIGKYKTYEILDPTGNVIVEFSNTQVEEIQEESDGEGGVDRWDEGSRRNAHFMAAACNAVRAHALSSRSPGGWRAIDSAPKDGTYFLGWHERYYEQRPILVYWLRSGLFETGGRLQPTYWQPLPEPPSPERKRT